MLTGGGIKPGDSLPSASNSTSSPTPGDEEDAWVSLHREMQPVRQSLSVLEGNRTDTVVKCQQGLKSRPSVNHSSPLSGHLACHRLSGNFEYLMTDFWSSGKNTGFCDRQELVEVSVSCFTSSVASGSLEELQFSHLLTRNNSTYQPG